MTVNILAFEEFERAAAAVSDDTGARYFGGGTLLMRELNETAPGFTTLVRCTDEATRDIVEEGDRVFIGASVTMSSVLGSRSLEFLHSAALSVGAPAIRNMATVGGNLFAPSPYGDFAVALLALDGEAVIVSGAGTKPVPLADLFQMRTRNERPVVAGVSIIKPRDRDGFRFLKAQRVKPRGSSVVTVAAHLEKSAGRIQKATVAYGAMAATPVRAVGVERALQNAALDERGIEPALAAALEGTDPPTDAIASTWYRQQVAPVYLKRLLLGTG